MISGRGSFLAFFTRDGRVEDGPDLHLDEVRDHQAEAAAAQAEHRVLLVHRLDRREQFLVLGRGLVAGLGDLDQLVLEVREELVQRRVDQADDDRQAAHRLEDALEVALLERFELGHVGVELLDGGLLLGGERLSGGSLGLGPGGHVGHEDHGAHDGEALALAEHVLGAAEADALGAVGAGLGGILGLVGVGPDLQLADLVGPAENGLEIASGPRSGLDRRQRAGEDFAGGAVEADPVAFLDGDAVGGRASWWRRRLPARRSRRRRACRSGGRRPRRARSRRPWRSGCPGRRPCRGSRPERSPRGRG